MSLRNTVIRSLGDAWKAVPCGYSVIEFVYKVDEKGNGRNRQSTKKADAVVRFHNNKPKRTCLINEITVLQVRSILPINSFGSE